MENRDRDKLSQSKRPTDAGNINRDTSERSGVDNDSSADFGQSIGRSEELNSPGGRGSSGTGRVSSTGMGKGQNRSSDDEGSSSGQH